MAFPLTDTVKTILGITGSTYDDLLDVLMPSVEDEIKEYCNTDFLDDDGNDIFPAAGAMVFAQMVGYWIQQSTSMGATAGVKSFTEGGYSETRETAGGAGYSAEITGKLDKWKVVRTGKGSIKTQWRDRRGYLQNTPEWNVPDGVEDES